eukprot:TRINITY_DN130_c0_g2_i1.p2 TRINITY_DN130_c0_g2~~TRINITY_DN130_c0_g2_i1.p2  ORF type:complete len:308 (-),score=81.04 TRINITY_DN130_c0_g2_i1:1075-1998(-)
MRASSAAMRAFIASPLPTRTRHARRAFAHPKAATSSPQQPQQQHHHHHHHQPAAPAPLCVLVPGKFDALHVGHRSLLQHAAALGAPTLLSFSGMAAALHWPPRAPVVAPGDRSRVLRSWNMRPAVRTHVLPFGAVRHMSPPQFVAHMRHALRASAVVCGSDWRFGRDASGDVHVLRRECAREGIDVSVAPTVHVDGRVVSSSRVRHALRAGDVQLVARLLGRLHRVVGSVIRVDPDGAVICAGFVNQVPAEGLYEAVVRVLGRTEPLRAKVQVQRSDDGERNIVVFENEMLYCEQCEMYIDFVHRLL